MHRSHSERSSSRRRRRSGNTVYGIGTKKSYKGQETDGAHSVLLVFVGIVVALAIAGIILGVVSRV